MGHIFTNVLPPRMPRKSACRKHLARTISANGLCSKMLQTCQLETPNNTSFHRCPSLLACSENACWKHLTTTYFHRCPLFEHATNMLTGSTYLNLFPQMSSLLECAENACWKHLKSFISADVLYSNMPRKSETECWKHLQNLFPLFNHATNMLAGRT